MKRITFKGFINVAGALLLTLAALIGVSIAQADSLDKDIATARHEAACYVYGVEAGVADVQLHAKRVQQLKLDPAGTAYVLGYHTGVLDTHASANAQHYGGYSKARHAAGVHYYKAYQCTTARSI
jgi:hypothetical protein